MGKTYSAKEPSPPPEEREFPMEIRHKKAASVTLYESPNRGTMMYTVAYKPNLNDGVLITASPLWKLFRLPKWQRDLKAYWEALEGEEYEWAHLAYTIWPDRVKKVCKKDRSIAIAHGLEDLCEVKAPEKKAKRGKKQANAELDLD